ncbi:MAG: hypothetical protein KAY37_07085 [Phycisphaerae bacterium]|nr:hypothetical protein [Phycisphaerae bacterium]
MALETPSACFPTRAYHPGRLDLSRDNPRRLTQCCGAARNDRGRPVTAPGVPPGYPEPAALVTSDCIEPPGQ